MNTNEIRKRLFELQDIEYKKFQLKLMPGVEEDYVIGVRTPALKTFAKEVIKSGYEEFINDIPHTYYEEMNLHVHIINSLKDYDMAVEEIDKILPYVNNWATCDIIKPHKVFPKNLERLEQDCIRWMSSDETYTIRLGIEMLMSYFLDDGFKEEHLEMVAAIKSEEYYVNMMRAWYYATALAKQYDATIKVIENRRLDDWTHNKSIQKARESFRITDEQKEYLKSLK